MDHKEFRRALRAPRSHADRGVTVVGDRWPHDPQIFTGPENAGSQKRATDNGRVPALPTCEQVRSHRCSATGEYAYRLVQHGCDRDLERVIRSTTSFGGLALEHLDILSCHVDRHVRGLDCIDGCV